MLKRFGAQDSRFSFPMEGYTLALDFPINRRTLDLMAQAGPHHDRPWRSVLPGQGQPDDGEDPARRRSAC